MSLVVASNEDREVFFDRTRRYVWLAFACAFWALGAAVFFYRGTDAVGINVGVVMKITMVTMHLFMGLWCFKSALSEVRVEGSQVDVRNPFFSYRFAVSDCLRLQDVNDPDNEIGLPVAELHSGQKVHLVGVAPVVKSMMDVGDGWQRLVALTSGEGATQREEELEPMLGFEPRT